MFGVKYEGQKKIGIKKKKEWDNHIGLKAIIAY